MTRKWTRAIAIIAMLGLAAGAVRLFQAEIGSWLLARVAAERVGRDMTAGLPDGLHVVLCGTGSPLPDPTRAGPCTLVIAGRQLIVVDAGEGGARNLAAMGVPMGRISALLLTHFHSDHIDGLGGLMLLRWTGGPAQTPLPIHGPVGVAQVVAGFNTAYALDNGYRVAHHGAAVVPPGGAGGVAMPFTAPGVILQRDGLTVTAFAVDHRPVTPAMGYRFDYKGRSVVITGDTARSPAVAKAARGADVLVHEALQPKLVARLTAALAAKGQANTAQITRDILDYHASPEDAAEIAAAAGVRRLVLSHIVPPLPFRFVYPAFLGDAATRFSGPIVVGEDGMMISLPAGGNAITMDSLL